MGRLGISIFFICFLCSGCVFDSSSDTVVDDYEVGWVDVRESRCLRKGEQLVPAYVFAAGHDKKFIFAKQNPMLGGSQQSITNYYIIEQTKSVIQDKPVYGPLNRAMFDSLCNKLGIVNPEFNLTYSQ